ncbi:MAG: histidinol-phosphate transaminase [Flavobacteriaceae bacterium]|nr:histidinol-phosphate transaminase [Bacteroidia bacterium]NNL61446.1 histidinol-phosphate transaminase [Flavobacteriaceae bacterium]
MIDIDTLVRENIKNLKPYSSARDEFKGIKDNMVFLDANENPFSNGINRYPDPKQQAVKDNLALIKRVSTENILLGNGSDEVIDLVFRAFCEPNQDNAILLPPTYGMYKVSADINSVETVNVELDEEFQPRVDEILNVANEFTKLLFICSPNNPSGNSFSIERIESLLKNFSGLVIIDEAYIDFSDQSTWLNRLEDYPNLIVCQTFSKAYGMAGIRLGVCYASKRIIDILNKIKPPYNVNELTQQKALDCLEDYNIVELQVSELKKNREWLIQELETLTIIKKIYPTDANFLLVKVDDAKKRYNDLLNKGIVVRNRSNQAGCYNCLRFTVGTENENKKLIEVLKTL